MKHMLRLTLLLIASLLIQLILPAQEVNTKFYDYQWRECEVSRARFYSTIEHTDSGWLRNDFFLNLNQLQMTALYADSDCKTKNGTAMYFYANGSAQIIARYKNGKREGTHAGFHNNGMMSDSANYINDKLTGTEIRWYPNGNMSDSIYALNDSVTVAISWFDNGNPSAYGYFINEKKEGRWKYFHKNGQLAALETSDHGKVIAVSYYNEDGTVHPDTSDVNAEATYKTGIKGWQKYLLDKTYWPEEYKITNTNTATVVTQFTINEDGKIEDAFVSTPFHPLMDKIALETIKKSPAWKPALDHNRKIKAYRRQPHTFMQE